MIEWILHITSTQQLFVKKTKQKNELLSNYDNSCVDELRSICLSDGDSSWTFLMECNCRQKAKNIK